MADKPKKKKGRPRKAPTEMTNDELIAKVFSKPIQKKLKKLAEEHRPEPEKGQ
jgi:hypothetical protein